ncbi:MAG: hypothetical protein J2P46_06785 [Zavarzinella sp.]|nr:hypothetical protein [Zavarzinella sp.]
MTGEPEPRRPLLRKVRPAQLAEMLICYERDTERCLAAVYDRGVRADAFLRGRPWEISYGGPHDPSELRARVSPVSALLATHLALNLHVPRGCTDASVAEWLADVVTGARAASTRCGGRPFAAAVRAIEELVSGEWGMYDPFRVDRLSEAVEDIELARGDGIALMAKRLGVFDGPTADAETADDFDRRVMAYAFGFDRIEPPGLCDLGDHYSALMRDIAQDGRVRAGLRAVRACPLAKGVLDQATPTDLVALGEELKLEFAAARARLSHYMSHVRIDPSFAKRARFGRRRTGRDPRGRFAHRLLTTRGTKTEKACLNEFNAEAVRQDWDEVSTIQGLRYIAAVYAERQKAR